MHRRGHRGPDEVVWPPLPAPAAPADPVCPAPYVTKQAQGAWSQLIKARKMIGGRIRTGSAGPYLLVDIASGRASIAWFRYGQKFKVFWPIGEGPQNRQVAHTVEQLASVIDRLREPS